MNKNMIVKGATMDTTTHSHKKHATAVAPFHSHFFESLHKEQWQEVRLGEIAEIFDHKRVPLSAMQRNNRKGIYPYYGASGIIDYIDDFIFDGEFILISEDGENLKTRKTPIAFRANGKFWVNNHAHIIKGKKPYLNSLIIYLFRNIDLNPYITGAVQPKLNQATLLNISFTIPIAESTRQQIAEILSSFDDKIDLLHRQNKTLESLALTLFRHIFIDNPNRNEWKMGKLGDYGKIICGKTPTKTQKEYFNGEIPFIKIPDMHNKTFVFKTADTLTQKGFSSQHTKTLPPLSICVSCIATVGVVSMNALESQTNQQINSIVPHKEYFRYFLYCFMKESFDELQAMASGGTATANLNTTDFSNMAILKPTDKELQDFHSCVKIYFDKIYNNAKQIWNLQSMRDMLLSKILNEDSQLRRKEQ